VPEVPAVGLGKACRPFEVFGGNLNTKLPFSFSVLRAEDIVLHMVAVLPEGSGHAQELLADTHYPTLASMRGVNTAIVALLEALPFLCWKGFKHGLPTNDVLALEDIGHIRIIRGGEGKLVAPFLESLK
jgi:hypothetical protein